MLFGRYLTGKQMIKDIVFGVRGRATGEVVEEVEGRHGGALAVPVAHEEAVAAEDGGPPRAREPQHRQPAAAQRGRCQRVTLRSPLRPLRPCGSLRRLRLLRAARCATRVVSEPPRRRLRHNGHTRRGRNAPI
ncbi:hypothetical protein ACJJTC_008465 [Scirpophaga incertulas]